MAFEKRLPESLQLTAYYAGEEAAWSKDDALSVIDSLSAQALAIEGIEVWLATEPGPTIPEPFFYGWQAEARRRGEDWSSYLTRVNQQATEYIRSFCWDPKDAAHRDCEPYFNLEPVAEENSESRGGR